MWNPQTYIDTDYGLDEGETFEPDTGWEPDPFDTTQPHIMTVLGPIDPAEVGICQVHEHILSDPPALRNTDATARLTRLDLASEDLGFYLTAGGTSMVEASTPDRGRDLPGLVHIAQRVPVHIIASGGRQDDQHAALMPAAFDQEALEEELREDIAADHKPGILAFGTTAAGITQVEQVAALAVSTVAGEHGYPVMAQVGAGETGQRALDLVESSGFPASRTIVGRLSDELPWNGLEHMARRGAWLSFDQIGRKGDASSEVQAGLLMRLAEKGLADQLLVSQGLARTSDLLGYGGSPGWVYLIERFTLTLMAAGAEALLVRKLLIDNPARALTVSPPTGSGDGAAT